MMILNENILIKIINKLGYMYSYGDVNNTFTAYMSSSDGVYLCYKKEDVTLKEGLLLFVVLILNIQKDDKYCMVKLPRECFGLNDKKFHFDATIPLNFYHGDHYDLLDVTIDEAMMVTQQIDKNGNYLNDEQKEKFKNYIINIDDIDTIIAYELTQRLDHVMLSSAIRADVVIASKDNYNVVSCISHNLQRERPDKLPINGYDVIVKFLNLNRLPVGHEYSMKDLFKFAAYKNERILNA